MAQWFRLYESVLDDPKVQKLPPLMFKAWVNLLALACRHNGELPSVADIGFALRMSEEKATELARELYVAGLLDRAEDGTEHTDPRYTPHNWASRQYKSDVSNEREKRYRERQRNAPCNVTETPSESEQIQNRTEQTPPQAARSQLLSEDWEPGEIEVAALKAEIPWLTNDLYDSRMKAFRDWCVANATRTFNPAATWRGFMRQTRKPFESKFPAKPDAQALPPTEPWEQRMKGYKPGVPWWNRHDWGPPPGEPGCRVPASLLASH
jgi:hypothetical protein